MQPELAVLELDISTRALIVHGYYRDDKSTFTKVQSLSSLWFFEKKNYSRNSENFFFNRVEIQIVRKIAKKITVYMF